MSKPCLALAVLAAWLSAGCQQAKPADTTTKTESTTTTEAPVQIPVVTTTIPGAPIGEAQVHKLANGLQYIDLVVGNGRMAEPGMRVSVHYRGWLPDGRDVDNSFDRGQPYEFPLGAGQVIAGWDEGIKGMRLGGKRKLMIPADMAYGAPGREPVVPPNSPLVFDVELVGVK